MVCEEENLSEGPYRPAVPSAGCTLELYLLGAPHPNEIRVSGGGARCSPGDSITLP